ncbi:hypothetical protein [Actinomadura xylanilytica]|uniref:hypothetical protein n=1 Tax=Actinomadura xylanilytica TaxID=887459 RepID=UPI00255A7A59|nr:hypothetical protein [Actinomadura xylanilytica]MDL4770740.1 hypothetical protein [Actinomadura xylanilytica]
MHGRGDGRSGGTVLVGAHGGAGVSTLARLMCPARDMGAVAGLLREGRPYVRAEGPVVLVARNTVSAAWHATRAVTAIDAARGQGDGHIAALVIVADGAGPEPKDAAARFGLLHDRVCGVVRMPFVPELRLIDDPATVPLPRKVREVLETVWELAHCRPCH